MKPRAGADVAIDLTFVKNRVKPRSTLGTLWAIPPLLFAVYQEVHQTQLIAAGIGNPVGHVLLIMMWTLILGFALGTGLERWFDARMRRQHGTWVVRDDELPPQVAQAVFLALGTEGVSAAKLEELAAALRDIGQAAAADACLRRAGVTGRARRASLN